MKTLVAEKNYSPSISQRAARALLSSFTLEELPLRKFVKRVLRSHHYDDASAGSQQVENLNSKYLQFILIVFLFNFFFFFFFCFILFVSEYFSKLNYKQFQVTTDSSVLSVFPLQAVTCISEMLQKCFPELDRKYTGIPDDEKGTVLTQYEHFKNVCDMMSQTFPSLGKILELHQFYSVPFNMELMCSLLQYLLQRRTFVWNLHSQHTPQSHDISDSDAAYNGGDSNWYKVSNQYPLMKENKF